MQRRLFFRKGKTGQIFADIKAVTRNVYRARLIHIARGRKHAHKRREHQGFAAENPAERRFFAFFALRRVGNMYAFFGFKINAGKQNVADYGAEQRNHHIFGFFKLGAAQVKFRQDKPEYHEKRHRHGRTHAVCGATFADNVAALGGVGGHGVRQAPKRHVGRGINHPPQHIGHRSIHHQRNARKVRRIKKQNRQNRNRDRRIEKIRTHFAAFRVGAVHNIAHNRVINRVPNACEQH